MYINGTLEWSYIITKYFESLTTEVKSGDLVIQTVGGSNVISEINKNIKKLVDLSQNGPVFYKSHNRS